MMFSYRLLITVLVVLCRVNGHPVGDVGSNGNTTTSEFNTTTSPESVTPDTPPSLDIFNSSTTASVAMATENGTAIVPVPMEDDLIAGLVDRLQNWLKTVKPNHRTLILSLAVLIGLLLIGCLIGLAICIFNSFQSCKGTKSGLSGANNSKPTIELATNPMYDDKSDIKYKPDFDPSASFSGTNDDIYPVNAPLLTNQVSGSKMLNALNSSSSISCSSTSINSVVFKSPNSVQIIKTPKSSDSRPVTGPTNNYNKNNNNEASLTSTPGKTSKNQNLRSSISNLIKKASDEKNQDSENERSCLLDEADQQPDQQSESAHSNDASLVSRRQPKFQHQVKSSQQLMREQKISKHPSYSRTQSHSECEGSNNRLSAASSRSSIAMPGIPLDFDQIKDDIDDLAVHKEKLVSRTNLQATSRNASQANLDSQSDSINNSIADIYIKELINKHQESTKKQNPTKKLTKASLDMSLSSSSIISETASKNAVNRMESLKKKRMSMNIDVSEVNFSTNPGGGVSTSNLDRNTSASAFTVSSEKSCY